MAERLGALDGFWFPDLLPPLCLPLRRFSYSPLISLLGVIGSGLTASGLWGRFSALVTPLSSVCLRLLSADFFVGSDRFLPNG